MSLVDGTLVAAVFWGGDVSEHHTSAVFVSVLPPCLELMQQTQRIKEQMLLRQAFQLQAGLDNNVSLDVFL